MEKNIKPTNGYLALLISLVLLGIAIKFFITAGIEESGVYTIPGILLFGLCIIIWKGLIIVQPNHARVLNLFGKYVGSIKDNGMFFVNPLYVGIKVSQRVQNMATPTLKVNDKMGNPVEIAAVVVWQIKDTYKAAYEVADYNAFVRMQSEAAVRALTMRFAYDSIEDQNADITLREGGDKIMELLQDELNERLLTAGIIVTEARISHLAYAQEIAGAMLQRQQASAIVAARFKIVEGAVGMVELALEQLSKKEIVHLDEEKKATMVSNLMVVLCGEKGAQPVLNTGSLYQ
ncbi:MAG: SPFH domain-containing protein [Chitinophagaceae bacterium]|nr:SPFH domain-containing protein [Chitinophagaceae bacterium]